MKRYEFPFCALAVPDDWVPVPPLGLADPRPEEVPLSLVVAEHWLADPVTAADLGTKQRDLLAKALDDFELISEQPWPDPRSGWSLAFEYENEELLLREMRIWRIRGPHVVALALQGPGGPHRLRDQIFEAVARSFEPRGDEVFEKAAQAPLLPDLEQGARPPVDPQAVRQKFPRVCVSLAVPRGWEAASEDGHALLRRPGVEVRLRRVLEHHPDPGLWFERKMKQLRDVEGALLIAWHQGTLPEGRLYAGVSYDETARSRAWSTAAVQRALEVAIAGRQLLEWSIRTPPSSFRDAQPLLQGLIAGAAFLDSAEWETRPAEPWAELPLRGPWDVQGPGTYTCLEPDFLLLQLSESESHASLEALRPRLLEGLRRATAARSNSEKESTGLFRNLEALRWEGQGKMAARAIWVRSGEKLFSCVLQGAKPERVEELFRQAVEGLRVPGMRS